VSRTRYLSQPSRASGRAPEQHGRRHQRLNLDLDDRQQERSPAPVQEIGAELFIAPKTASVHVSNILAKLGAASRTEAAAIAHGQGLGMPAPAAPRR